MKNRKYSNFKRTPLVRFIRSVLRFFKALFKPKKGAFTSHHRQNSSDEHSRFEPLTSITELGDRANGSLVTVGELLERVNWQFSKENIHQKVSGRNNNLLDDVSLN